VLDARTRLLGPEHPDTLTAMSNLASSLQSMGDLPGARELEERVVGVRTRVLGPEHPDTLTAMSNLASSFQSMGDSLLGTREPETTKKVSASWFSKWFS
jgi:hypothetical protein